MELTELLKKRSKELGRTALAKRIGVDQSTVYRYEEGLLPVPVATLRSLAAIATEDSDTELLGSALCYATGLADNGRSDELGRLWLEATDGAR